MKKVGYEGGRRVGVPDYAKFKNKADFFNFMIWFICNLQRTN
jgi:hypothetical protein